MEKVREQEEGDNVVEVIRRDIGADGKGKTYVACHGVCVRW